MKSSSNTLHRTTPRVRRRLRSGSGRPVAALVCAVLLSVAGRGPSDILRGGAAAGSPAAPGGGLANPAPGGATPADTSAARAAAHDALARTTNALQAVRNMQDAARAAAIAGPNRLGDGLPEVPDGMQPGGLVPVADAGVVPDRWQGAELPTETTGAGGVVKVGIRQTAQQALLDWQTFNIGKNTTLSFDQSAAGTNVKQWVAFNRVSDPTAHPSQILGRIEAPGQVYVINPNGVIFGGSSQVNTSTLTVTSLPINTNLLERGLLNNPDAQFLLSGLNLAAGPNGTPAFTPDPPPAATGRYGDITVQAGAILNSPTNESNAGGRIMLAGPNVSNAGSILTPDGQAILAAGLQVGIAGHDAADPSLRGLDIYVGQIGSYGGAAINNGLIAAARGNITIVGAAVGNHGALTATTSVSLNGRIDLLAHYGATSNPASGTTALVTAPFLNRSSGALELGPGSVIEILPEYASKETVVGTELALRSRVNLAGKSVHMGRDATLFAPNALVSIAAGEWLFIGGVSPSSRFIQSAGQVYLDENALINVAGSIDVGVSVAQNIIEVDLRGAELANSPLQREGVLRGDSVKVDIRDAGIYKQVQWLGTPLADVSGFANLIERGVGQLTTAGGSVTISAGNSMVLRDGARIDVSGGSTLFQEDYVQTTQLISNGRLVDISQALPDVVYQGIYDGTQDIVIPKWGVDETYYGVIAPDGRRLEAGYLDGAAGGTLSITAPAMALDGMLLGRTYAGEFQRATRPAPSSLTIAFTAVDRSYASLPTFAPTPPAITFSDALTLAPPDPFSLDAAGNPLPLPPERIAAVVLDPELLETGGFDRFTLTNPDGSIAIPEGVAVRGNAFGSITMNASVITIDGSVSAPSGSLSFLSANLPLSTVNQVANTTTSQAPPALSGRGVFTLGPRAELTVAGLLVDDRASRSPSPASGSQPLALAGGSITIRAYDAQLAAGAVVDASGGARADTRSRLSYGNGGLITINAGNDLNIPAVTGGALDLGASLSAHSGARAGSLALTAPAIQLGGPIPADPRVLHLDPGFVARGGFGSYALFGIGLPDGTPGMLVAPGTALRSVATTRYALAAFGEELRFLDPMLLPEGVRTPVNLSLASPGLNNPFTSTIIARGDTILGAGASIVTDAKATVTLSGRTTTVLGSITAPGGAIQISGSSNFPVTGDPPLLSTVLIGADVRLDAAGKTVLVPDPYGFRTGEVLAGGTIAISGNIVAEAGARFDVSGTTGVLDLPPTQAALGPAVLASFTGRPMVPVQLDSNGGTIRLTGSNMLHSDATFRGTAGGPSAIGGTLEISSGRYVPTGQSSTTADINLVVKQSGLVMQGAVGGVATLPLDPAGQPLPGRGMIAVESFASGGFHSLTLGGNIRFDGDVAINLPGRLRIATGGVIEATGQVALTAAYLGVGQAFRPPALPTDVIDLFTKTVPGVGDSRFNFVPTSGSGTLDIHARALDIGTLSLQQIGAATFAAPQGDIRGNGTLQAAGSLTFAAGQIHPTTGSAFNIFAYDASAADGGAPGSITILPGSVTRPLPLAGGGTLGLYASTISHGGYLTAPIGTINLGWDGSGAGPVNPVAANLLARPVTSTLTLTPTSVTTVAAIDPLSGKPVSIPYGISFDGSSWIDPAGLDITVVGPPQKAVNLAALEVIAEPGSLIDVSGGGDLFAYRWIQGNGGRFDVLAASDRFAIVPGYDFDSAPYAAFNTQATALDGNPGYVNTTLRAGDKITLSGGAGLPAGTYTLLPARYALLDGAFLVTPADSGSTASNPTLKPDGSAIVPGYRSNDLDPSRTGPTRIVNFEVAPREVVLARAEYQILGANKVLTETALDRGNPPPRVPLDAGRLSFTATAGMTLAGNVRSLTPEGGRGSMIDINSPIDILINSTGLGDSSGSLILAASSLNQFGAQSLLIGGLRSSGTEGVEVSVGTGRITVDNAGSPLEGADVILVARESITLADGAELTGTGVRDLDDLILGDAAVAGSGNGVLVRVSGASGASVQRNGVTPGGTPIVTIGAGAVLGGGSVVIDSTARADLDPGARFSARAVSLSSGDLSILLDNPGTLLPTTGLVLSGDALAGIQTNTRSLTLRSYSNLDIYGTGAIGGAGFDALTFETPLLRGINQNGGTVTVAAAAVQFANPNQIAPAGPSQPLDGQLVIDAGVLTLTDNDVRIDGFADLDLGARLAVIVAGRGSFTTQGDMGIDAPLLTGQDASDYHIAALGNLAVTTRPHVGDLPAAGFGAEISLSGASVAIDSQILLPGGELTVRATTGDVTIGGTAPARIDLAGTSRNFLDTTRFTPGGAINLVADAGSVRVLEQAFLGVGAPQGGGDAGSVNVLTPNGGFVLTGTLDASAGPSGRQGSFTLDAASIPSGSLAALDTILDVGRFSGSRDYRIRTGNVLVEGLATSSVYRLAADAGDITVTGTINASGTRGGTIDLKAHGSLVLAPGAVLDASATAFDAAGKGGAVTLEAGAQRNGVVPAASVLDLRAGAEIRLGVAENTPTSAALGQFAGTLHLRAPRNAANSDIQIAPIGATIRDASAILVEGYRLYDLTGTPNGTITTAVQNQIRNEASAFLGSAGTASAAYSAMLARLTALQPSLDLILAPGAEVINRSGDLTLGATNSTRTADWNLAGFRFGPRSAPGVLTLRAADNLTFFNALSDGFDGGPNLWLSPLLPNNPLLPANSQSWSLRLSSGADFTAASFRGVRPLESLATGQGLLRLGKNLGAAAVTGGANALTATLAANNFHVIRTGSGNIDIHAGRSVQLLNPFAAIYTAGTQVADPTGIFAPGDFVTPILVPTLAPGQGPLGAAQQQYGATYSLAGGNLTIHAGQNLERKTRDNSGLIDDSSRQLPVHWLSRRGYVDASGNFGRVLIGTLPRQFDDPAASTTWWIDFSNFFQSSGALGGGNVVLSAGNDILNFDAVIPTNARAPIGTPDPARIVELGGGDLIVRAGRNIDGGIYYVERGTGTLTAGAEVTTNATRSPSLGILASLNNPGIARLDPLTWLPTTLFVGKSSFDVTARGDILLGPATNPFLLPQGGTNKFWYKTFLSTFSPDAAVSILSLGGDVTLRNSAVLPDRTFPDSLLSLWFESQHILGTANTTAAFSQPWLRLVENSITPFLPTISLAAPTLKATAIAGSVEMVGSLTLFPSPQGQLELIASSEVRALAPGGLSRALVQGSTVTAWVASTVNLSDADPAAVPQPLVPLTPYGLFGGGLSLNNNTQPGVMSGLASLFNESGSSTGANAVLQTKQARHTPGGLHLADPEPVRIYAMLGDVSGLTLFTPKRTQVVAGGDIADISFYIQNLAPGDLSLISSGGYIVPSNDSSVLRSAAASPGNAAAAGQGPAAGDLQISGPGQLHVLAGSDLDLGLGTALADGTGAGITSIGNFRNPFLPAGGADVLAAAGLGPNAGLTASSIDFATFATDILLSPQGLAIFNELYPGQDFNTLSESEQATASIEVFLRVLRDTGRAYNDPASPGYQSYDSGFAAITALFGSEPGAWRGDILARGRDIRTRNGGDIRLLVPGGGLTLANTTIGNPLAPPGIVTEAGGEIGIFTHQSVDIGIGRIFTLRGGDLLIWSSAGDIAAGTSSRTVQSAPPTRVVIDPQSASVETDLAGLATGGGIGVLATVEGVKPGDVDLIAPAGIIDAGDAGIRVSGNINLAAVQVVNSGNIAAGGSTTGGAVSVAAPSVSAVTSASTTAAGATSSADSGAGSKEQQEERAKEEQAPSLITVEVIGYGGRGPDDEEDEEDEDARPAAASENDGNTTEGERAEQ